MTSRRWNLVAALPLAVAVVVIVVSPMLLESPNALSTPAALIAAIGCGGALLGGRGGERVALTVSVVGFVVSVLWLWLASDGFGKGTPWWDDMVEAAILATAFLVAAVVLLLGRQRHARADREVSRPARRPTRRQPAPGPPPPAPRRAPSSSLLHHATDFLVNVARGDTTGGPTGPGDRRQSPLPVPAPGILATACRSAH